MSNTQFPGAISTVHWRPPSMLLAIRAPLLTVSAAQEHLAIRRPFDVGHVKVAQGLRPCDVGPSERAGQA